jgi:hypothetical protein
MAKGGKREGAGRKPLSLEDDVKSAIRSALATDPEALTKVWEMVIKKAKEGSDKHINILFAYNYGKPKENQGLPSEMIITVKRVRR